MALVLTRKCGESITIGPDIEVRVTQIDRGRVRLAVTAPEEAEIKRCDNPGADKRHQEWADRQRYGDKETT